MSAVSSAPSPPTRSGRARIASRFAAGVRVRTPLPARSASAYVGMPQPSIAHGIAGAEQLADALLHRMRGQRGSPRTASHFPCKRPASRHACPSSCARVFPRAGPLADRSRGRRRSRPRARAACERRRAVRARPDATRMRSQARRRRDRRMLRQAGLPGSALRTSGGSRRMFSPCSIAVARGDVDAVDGLDDVPAPHGYPERVHRRSVDARAARGRGLAPPARPGRQAVPDRAGRPRAHRDAEDVRPAARRRSRARVSRARAPREAAAASRPTTASSSLMVHLMSAGRLRTCRPGEKGPKTPVFRLRFTDGGELVLTEAGRRSARASGCCVRTRSRRSSRTSARRPDELDAEALARDPRLRLAPAAFAAARPAPDRRHRPRLGERDPLGGAALALRALDPARRRGGRAARDGDPRRARARPRAAPRRARTTRRLPRAQQARRALRPLRHAARPRRLRGAHDLLLPGVPDRRPRAQGPAALASPQITGRPEPRLGSPRDQNTTKARRLARGRLRPDVQRQERGADPPAAACRDRRPARADREAAIDDRYDVGHVVSHAGAKMRAVTAATSDEVRRLAQDYAAVGIDEVQFFEDSIVDAIDVLVRDGARVVAAGLAQDFRGLPFGAMPTLLCVAEFVDKLEAVCHRCGGPATMTQRLVDGAPAPFAGETIQVGALDSTKPAAVRASSRGSTSSSRSSPASRLTPAARRRDHNERPRRRARTARSRRSPPSPTPARASAGSGSAASTTQASFSSVHHAGWRCTSLRWLPP